MVMSRAIGIAILYVAYLVGAPGPVEADTRGGSFELFGTVTVNPTPGVPTPFDTLVKIDPQTAAQTLAGPVGAAIGVNQLDADPETGMLFGTNYSTPGVIYQIDPGTGVASIEGHVAAGVNAVAFAPNGTFYGVDWSDISAGNVLGRIDLTTQTFTPVMRLPPGIRVDAIDFSPDGLLYAIYVQFEPFQQWLVALDVQGQSVVSRTRLGTLAAVGDIDYAPDGFIYHSNFSFGLFRIDPNTEVQVPENLVQVFVGFGSVGAAGSLASVAVTAPITVDIDIKPGASPNVINPCSAGVVPVAILSSPSFDANTIDPTTVKLNDARPRVAGKSGRLASLSDVDGDGDLDLVIHVRTTDLKLSPGDVTVTLTGDTFDGAQILGIDAVKLVFPRTGERRLGRVTCSR